MSIGVDIELLGGLLGLGVFLRGVEVGDVAPRGGERQDLVRLGFDVVLHALAALRHGCFQAACQLCRPMGEQGEQLVAVLQGSDALGEDGAIGGGVELGDEGFGGDEGVAGEDV